jgi:hypothetical protein
MTAQLTLENPETRLTRQRYDRIAPFYDAMEWMVDWRARRWQRELCAAVEPGKILELGAGTGKNIRYYPEDAKIDRNLSLAVVKRIEAWAPAALPPPPSESTAHQGGTP